MPEKKTRRKARRARGTELVRDNARLVNMYYDGMNQRDIAKELGLSQSIVSTRLKQFQAMWVEKADIDFDAMKRADLEKLDRYEIDILEQWERSKTVLVGGDSIFEIADLPSKHGGKLRAPGDARYMALLIKIIEMRQRLVSAVPPEGNKQQSSYIIKLTGKVA